MHLLMKIKAKSKHDGGEKLYNVQKNINRIKENHSFHFWLQITIQDCTSVLRLFHYGGKGSYVQVQVFNMSSSSSRLYKIRTAILEN